MKKITKCLLLITTLSFILLSGCNSTNHSSHVGQSLKQENSGGKASHSENIDNPSNKETNPQLDGYEVSSIEDLYGTWKVWIPGGFVEWYDKESKGTKTLEYQIGQDAGTVVVNSNGIYKMSHGAWGNEIVQNTWHIANVGEINGEEVTAIILENGLTETDWAIAPSPSGKIRLLQRTDETWTDGTSIWLFVSELYR